MDIEAVIAQAQEAQPESKATEVAETTEAPVEAEAKEEPKKQEIKPDSELTPEQLAKREANRQSHLNSKLAKMRRENRELRELVQKATQTGPQTKTDNGMPQPPREEDFQDWDSFRAAERKHYEDLADWKIEQKLSERDKKSTESTEQARIQQYQQERINQHAQKEVEFAKLVPDYEQRVYGDYGQFMSDIPPVVANALLEADNASLALYALAIEGTLEQLEDMSPYRVSIEIGKAEVRGETYLNRKKTTSAPAPIAAARGTGTTEKALHNQSVEELMKKFNSR